MLRILLQVKGQWLGWQRVTGMPDPRTEDPDDLERAARAAEAVDPEIEGWKIADDGVSSIFRKGGAT